MRDADERAFLPPAQALMETPAPPLPGLVIRIAGIAVVVAISWTIIGTFDIVAVAHGHALASPSIRSIHLVESSRIVALLVHEGQRVLPGEVLFTSVPAAATQTPFDLASPFRAPIAGTVYQVAQRAEGETVSTSKVLMRIIPDDAPLRLDAALFNRDIGFVQPGQQVRIKVDAFPFTTYGIIEGEVITVVPARTSALIEEEVELRRGMVESHRVLNQQGVISHTELASSELAYGESRRRLAEHMAAAEGGGTRFECLIEVPNPYLESNGRRLQLLPGMSITAEIHTGRRHIISYIISPLGKILDESLHER